MDFTQIFDVSQYPKLGMERVNPRRLVEIKKKRSQPQMLKKIAKPQIILRVADPRKKKQCWLHRGRQESIAPLIIRKIFSWLTGSSESNIGN